MYQISARFGFQDYVTYQDADISARVTGGGLVISRNDGGNPLLVPVASDDVTGWLEAIDFAADCGYLSEPAASCLSMLVEEPWLEGGSS